jgi:hypothetical protein
MGFLREDLWSSSTMGTVQREREQRSLINLSSVKQKPLRFKCSNYMVTLTSSSLLEAPLSEIALETHKI